eukprot:Rmarinus@m.16247
MQKNREIEAEDHMKQLNEREAGRIESEMKRLERELVELQDKHNINQNHLFRGNETMDHYRKVMDWNQEELHQWALAAKQKEEDTIALLKYTRIDEGKAKRLNLELEKLTKEVSAKKLQLAAEITETQAKQIELDKTAEDFRALHKERQELVRQWQESVQAMQRRHEDIRAAGERFAAGKATTLGIKEELQEQQKFHDQEVANNKELEGRIAMDERKVAGLRLKANKVQHELLEITDEVGVVRNELGKASTELSQTNNQCAVLSDLLKQKREKHSKLQVLASDTKRRLEMEYSNQADLEKRASEIEKIFKEEEERYREMLKMLQEMKDRMFKQSQELWRLRQEEANLIGEISGAQTSNKNLTAKIRQLDAESLKQQELIYNADFQIQQMERKVARAQGERSDAEKKVLNEKIRALEAELKEENEKHSMLCQQVTRVHDDLKAAKRKVDTFASEKGDLDVKIGELNLENDTLARNVRSFRKRKEDKTVQHDVLKLEAKRLRQFLNSKADEVFGLENRLAQLQLSMEERQKEIAIHHESLKAQQKAAEEDRHQATRTLNEREQKLATLQKKYETLTDRGGDNTGEEHTQAYYIIKAAQQREELQRTGDSLDADIRKMEKEVRALESMLRTCDSSNHEYRGSFMKADKSSDDYKEKTKIQERLQRSTDKLKYRLRELESLEQDASAMDQRFQSVEKDTSELRAAVSELKQTRAKIENELGDQDARKNRAAAQLHTAQTAFGRSESATEDMTASVKAHHESWKRKTALATLYKLRDQVEAGPFVEMFDSLLTEKGFNRPDSGLSRGAGSRAGSRPSSRPGSRPSSRPTSAATAELRPGSAASVRSR